MERPVDSVWDRLTSPECAARPDHHALQRRAIARDLEALLNTRTAIAQHELNGLPYCRDSIANFGMADFAQLCLASSADRAELCVHLAAAIARHEPRLRAVHAQLIDTPGSINRLNFVLHGQLRTTAQDDIRFDITLQPSNLRYTIR